MTPSNKRNPQRVKTRFDTRGSENGVDSPVLVSGEGTGLFGAITLKVFKRRSKPWVNRNRKKLSRIYFSSLCVANSDAAGNEVNISHRNLALRKPATGVKADLERDSRPTGLFRQGSSQRLNFFISQLGLYLVWLSCNAQAQQRVGFTQLPAYRLVHELRQEFEFNERGIVFDLSTVNFGGHSPGEIIGAVGVSNLSRVNDIALSQEHLDRLPSNLITAPGVLTLEMGQKVLRDPSEEGWTRFRGSNVLFNGSRLLCETLSLPGFELIVPTQTGRLLEPAAGIELPLSEKPERRARMFSERGHDRASIVSHGLCAYNENDCVSLGFTWGKLGLLSGGNSTITPRGTDFPSCEARSLTRVSQFGLSPKVRLRGNPIPEGAL